MTGLVRTIAWVALGAAVGFLLFAIRPAVHTLPEYATRTGESCATCHVNPAGGGPRTIRGSLWIAAGKPDQVPPLPGAPASGSPATGTTSDQALYEKFGCAACHGAAGEGGAGPALNKAEPPADQLTQVIRNGRGAMTAYKQNTMTDAELAAVVRFVQAIGRGEVVAEVKAQAPVMQPARAVCGSGKVITSTLSSCGGN